MASKPRLEIAKDMIKWWTIDQKRGSISEKLELKSWSDDDRIEVDENFNYLPRDEISTGDSEIKVVASKDIQSGEIIIESEPWEVPIDETTNNADGTAGIMSCREAARLVCENIFKEDVHTEEQVQHFALFLFVMRQMALYDDVDPYLQSWPWELVRKSFPVFWDEDQVKELKGTQCYQALCELDDVKSSMLKVIMPIAQTCLGITNTSLDSFLLVHAAFQSRVIPSTRKDEMSALFPLIDLCNGCPSGLNNATFVPTPSGGIKVQAICSIKQGDEILIDYLDGMPTSKILSTFGFVFGQPQLGHFVGKQNLFDDSCTLFFLMGGNPLRRSLKTEFRAAFGPNVLRNGVRLPSPEPRDSVQEIHINEVLERLCQFGPSILKFFSRTLSLIQGTNVKDVETCTHPHSSRTERVIAQARLIERNNLFRWAFNVARMLELSDEEFFQQMGSDHEFCAVCGWTMGLMPSQKVESVHFCSMEHVKVYCRQTENVGKRIFSWVVGSNHVNPSKKNIASLKRPIANRRKISI